MYRHFLIQVELLKHEKLNIYVVLVEIVWGYHWHQQHYDNLSVHSCIITNNPQQGRGGKGYIQLPISDIGKCFCNQYHTN